MKARSKSVLGADLSLSARRPITGEEESAAISYLPEGTDVTKVVELYSMVTKNLEPSRLVRIKAVSEGYPYYGGLKFSLDAEVNRNLNDLHSAPEVFVYNELLSQMNLSVGDTIKIGSIDFRVAKAIHEDTTAGMGASFAPTVYMSTVQLEKTGLITEGSVAWHSRLYRLPLDQSSQVEQLKQQLFEKLPNPDIRVETHLEASEQMARLLQRLNDYLGLAAVVALFLAAVGAGFLYRSYFQKKIKEIAILSALGLSKNQGALYYIVQVMLLGFVSAFVSIGISFLVVPVIRQLTSTLIPFEFEYVLTAKTVVVSIAVAVLGSFFVCLPFLSQIRSLSPALLLTEFRSAAFLKEKSILWLCLPGFAMFAWLSVWQANSLQTGLIFVGAFLLAGVGLSLVCFSGLWLLEKYPMRIRSLAWQWSVRDLVRDKATSISCFLALGLGAVLLNLVPQVQASLEHELEAPETSKLPSLFMFDVQDEQLEVVRNVFASENHSIMQTSPMIRARLMSVNDQPFDKGEGAARGLSREEQQEMRFRNRGFNLSYREGLSEAESLVAGEPIVSNFIEGQSEIPLISVEQRFADRLKLNIGDVLDFEIEGVSIKGKVVNLRSVKWTSFQPNFFIQFQPGVLESAPKTYILTAGPLSDSAKAQLQKKLVEHVPNISIIDVSQLVKKISELIYQMSLALQAMAILCLIAGFVVIFSIVSHQMENRRWQIGLYKVLGTPFSIIQRHIHLQYLLLALTSAFFGISVSALFSYVLSIVLFENVWVFDWMTPVISLLIVAVTTLLVVHVASYRYLQEEPKNLLR